MSEEGTVQYLSFVVYFVTDFEMLLKKIQTMCPLEYILYTEMENLLWNTMSKFIRSKFLCNHFASDVFDMYQEEEEFWQNCLLSFINTVAHMMTKLPFNTFLKNCLYIHPSKRNKTNLLGGISGI